MDQAIILAASLAIKSGSAMSNMFKDMINDKEDILVKVENCVYEDNLGILGWYGNKRMIMGSREQMKHHDIKLPDMKKVRKYAGDSTEIIYLSVADGKRGFISGQDHRLDYHRTKNSGGI